jgi:hypothetical protein
MKLGWYGGFLGLFLMGLGGACSSSTARQVFDDPVDGSAFVDAAAPPSDETGSLFQDAAPQEDLSPKGNWSGRVYTPAGDIPIAGALVYLSQKRPDPIPDGNFCDKCVELDKSVPKTLSKADGTFVVTANRSGVQYLVIQKGQFRKVVEIDVKGGDVTVAKADTTFPRRKDAATGDMVPTTAVVDTNYDDIEEALTRLGIPITDMIPQAQRVGFLRDATKLAKYNIIFLPCGTCATAGGSIFSGPDDALDPAIQRNLKEWVQKGGKLYVTDFEYSFINETWKNYVTFTPNKGCDSNSYNTPATIADPGLKDWLDGQNHRSVTFENAWIKVDRVNEVDVPDGAGGTKKLTPKVWAFGNDGTKNRPMTLSFEDACGRVLYSAYHTEGDGSSSSLLPQEKALVYVLFEVSTCLIDPIIPK